MPTSISPAHDSLHTPWSGNSGELPFFEHTMTEPVILKNSLSIALVAMLQAIMPSVVAVSSLYFLIFVYGVEMKDYFHSMAVLVALLALLLPHPPRTANAQIFSGTVPLAVGVIIRWSILLAVLLAVAYVSKFTEAYSRRVVITWAVVTPAMLIVVSLIFHEIMRRLLCNP